MNTTHFGDGSPASRAQSAMAHALIYVLAVAVLVRIVSWFGRLGWVDVVMAAMLLACWAVLGFHRRRDHLCARCMDDIPADAPTQAERRWRLLRFAHLNQTLWGLAITTLLLVGARLPQVVTDDPALRPLQIPGDLWLFAVIYTEWLHHRLRPWCPYCRPWDDGGDEEPAPDPTLFDTKTGG